MKRLFESFLLGLAILVCLSACAPTEQNPKTGIEGMWETSANGINDGSKNSDNNGVVRYCFNGDMSGELITYANDEKLRSDFSYSLSEDNIQIDFGSGPVWSFQYRLDGNVLILVQNNNEIIYERVE